MCLRSPYPAAILEQNLAKADMGIGNCPKNLISRWREFTLDSSGSVNSQSWWVGRSITIWLMRGRCLDMKQPFGQQIFLNAPLPVPGSPDLCNIGPLEFLFWAYGMAGDLTGLMVVENDTVVLGFDARYSGQM
jgi:hypothetical protein